MVELRVDEVKLPDALMRQTVNDEKMEGLAKSIRRWGIVVPLIVRPMEGHYELIAGMRRLMAAEMVGLEVVPVIVRESDDGESEAVKMVENREREEVNAVDEAKYMAAVMERNGWTQKEMAKELGVSEGLVSQRLKIATWSDTTKRAVAAGNLRFSVAREIEQIKDDREKERLVRVAVDSGVSPNVAAQWRREINAALEAEQMEVAMETTRRIVHQPQTVYVTCQTCEGAVKVEEVVFVRICAECWEIMKKGK